MPQSMLLDLSLQMPENAEAGVLLRRKGPKNFIEQLGINIHLLQQFELPEEKRKITEIGDNEPISKTKITIPLF